MLNNEKLENRTFKTEVHYSTALKLKASVIASKKIFVSRRGSYYIDSKLQERLEFDIIDRYLDLEYDSLQDFDADLKRLCMLKWDHAKKKANAIVWKGFSTGSVRIKWLLKCFWDRYHGLSFFKQTRKEVENEKLKVLFKEMRLHKLLLSKHPTLKTILF